jgi:hypothetical protein
MEIGVLEKFPYPLDERQEGMWFDGSNILSMFWRNHSSMSSTLKRQSLSLSLSSLKLRKGFGTSPVYEDSSGSVFSSFSDLLNSCINSSIVLLFLMASF